MKEISIEEIKVIQLDLLNKVDEVCRANNLRYSLGGGTLLGAVRHKGYIPWDDDIDIMMPRPDYEIFIQLINSSQEKYKIQCFLTDFTYVDLSAKFYDSSTILIDDIVDNKKQIGVSIDIFPIDGLGNSKKEAVKAFRKKAFLRELLVAAQWKKYFRSKTHAWYYEIPRFLLFCISRNIDKTKIFREIEKYYISIKYDEVSYVAAVGGSYREREILPKQLYSEFVLLEFENKKYYVIKGYDEYLTSIFGDYMTLPPIEKRVSHHFFKAYIKEE